MTLNVADISRYQDTSVIPALRGGGTDAIIVGVTFGCAGNNPIYAQQLDATTANGMLRGAYHIRARVNWTPQQEADFFLSHIAGYLDGRTILVLDWEECDTSDEAWALAWLQYVEAKTGIKPWFYVNLSDLLTYRYPQIAANGNAIWLAQYPYSSVNGYAGVNWQPQAIPAGHALVAWQYVGTGGTVNGVGQLDLSVAYINADGWLAYASSTSTQSGTITPILEDELMSALDEPITKQDGGTTTLRTELAWLAKNFADVRTLVASVPGQSADHVLNAPITKQGGGTTTPATEFSWLGRNFTNIPGTVWNAKVNGASTAAGVLNHIDATPAGTTTVANTVAALSPADFAALAKAVNDEADARATRRLATP